MHLFAYLQNTARRYSREPAVFHGCDLFATYATLLARSKQLASALSKRANAGSRIGIVTPNCPQYVEIMYGTWAAGMCVVPINAKLHPREMTEILLDAGVSCIFASPEIASQLAVGMSPVVIGSEEYEEYFKEPPIEDVDRADDDLAWLFFTSGTTGRPKGAMLTHRNLNALILAYLADFDCVESDHSLIHAAPMSHGSGLYIPVYVARGARQVIPKSGRFDPAEFCDLCNLHSHCAAFLAPTMVRRLREEVEKCGVRPKYLRTITYGGGPMYVDELCKARASLGDVLLQVYGQGEAPMTITGLRRNDHRTSDATVLGSVGWPRTGVEVAIVDDAMNKLPVGMEGEIVCRGDIVMKGYWNNEDATANTIRGGWLRTGDLGRFAANGNLYLLGRSKELIISGGSNIYPLEVEDVLIAHEGVSEVGVIGLKDEEWGEIVVAFVVPVKDYKLTVEKLEKHCIENIARFKRPKRYVFLDALPKNNYGKVVKTELAKLL